MAGIVPLISSGVAGPLGVLHLPRLWCKVILGAKGQLADGYDQCGMGYDQMVLDGLGLDRDATVAYLSDNIPSYPEFEKWILDQKGGSLDSNAVPNSTAPFKDTTTQTTPAQPFWALQALMMMAPSKTR